MSPERNKKKKRGVILLIVVSLLTLLVLIGVTFVLFANRSKTASDLEVRRGEYDESPEKMFEQVVGQLLYDTVARSALRGHSFLQDLYGPDFITGQVTNVNPISGNPNNDNGDQWPASAPGAPYGQAFAFQCTFAPANQQMPWLDYYTGRVITFTSGPAAGHSTRILQYDPTPMLLAAPQPARLHIEAIETTQFAILVPAAGDTFIINGAPFNGAGAGFDDTNAIAPNPAVLNISAVYAHQSVANLPAVPSGDLVALLPHFNGYDPHFGLVYLGVGIAGVQNAVRIDQGLARGGFDEPWDAADYQNMFLAMQPPARAELAASGVNTVMLPSFHRPELVNYWVNYMRTSILSSLGTPAEQFQVMAQPYGPDTVRNTADEANPPYSAIPLEERDRVQNITRSSIFRPMPWDHENFTGSNPSLVGSGSTITGLNAIQLFNVLCGYEPSTTFPGAIANANLYDVDNDNDTLADSIWVDPGLPVVTMPDGKRYKRMVAIVAKDLDGRIDLNAHGNLGQVARIEQPPGSGQYILPNRPQFPVPQTIPGQLSVVGLAVGPPANTNPNRIYLPRGVGYGPAEVDFLNLFIPPTNAPPGPTTDFQVDPAIGPTVIAIQAYENLLRGRYESSATGPGPTQDLAATAFPGVPLSFEALNIVKQHGSPNDYANVLSWYASPPDVWGRGAVVLDWGGQPLYWPLAGTAGEMLDNPYEISLGDGVSNSDSPYTLVELERMLRYHDVNAQKLPSRPLAIDQLQLPANRVLTYSPPGIIGPDHTARQRMSGLTSSMPSPSGLLPGTQVILPTGLFPDGSWRSVEARVSNNIRLPGNTTILDMYATKIRFTGGAAAATPAALNNILNQLVPWELRHGGKFDLNRWLGNGFDGQAPFVDGVADDPIEAFADPLNPAPFGAPPYIGPREQGWNAPAQFMVDAEHANGNDVNNDGVPTFLPGSPAQRSLDRMLARQLYARHLFCLMTLFIDPTFDPPMPHEPTLTTPQRQELMLRRIAQWAINVVDYRDSDAIMTPFEYDVNPWNGWDVDSRLETDGSAGPGAEMRFNPATGSMEPVIWTGIPPNNNERRLVWGNEQPDLLLTETLAFHSRNVKDTDVAGPDAGGMPDQKRSDPMTRDTTLDQFRVPQGSLFIEVYCPRAYRWFGPPTISQQGHQKPRLPLELYDLNGFLQLGRLAPPRPGDAQGRPVWRMALAPLINEEDAGDPFKPVHPQTLAGVRTDRDPAIPLGRLESSSFDWQDTSLLNYPGGPTPPAPAGALAQFRYAYFGDASVLPANELAQSFHNTTSFPLLQPGGYAVLGPRATTYLGSCNPGANPIMWDTALGTSGYSNQRFVMDPTAGPNVFEIYDTTNPGGTLTTRTPVTGNIRSVVSIIADYQGTPQTIGAVDWAIPANLPWRSGLNITEPLMRAPGTNYYPEPMDPASLTTPGLPPDAGLYDDPDPTVALNDGTGFKNTPIEGDDPGNAGRPIYENSMQNTGTYEDVSSVYLERLANPNLPWNPLPTDPGFGVAGQFPSYNAALLINPYITVDWASIDVTVFAGDEDTDQQTMMPVEWFDPDDEDPSNELPVMAFRSRQRGYQQGYTSNPASLVPQGSHQSPWSPVTRNTLPSAGNPYDETLDGAAVEPYFKVDLSNDLEGDPNYTTLDRHTFGYLNSGLGLPAPAAAAPPPPPPNVLPYLGEAQVLSPTLPGQRDPAPFPWLTFANRPFANPYELLMVPASSPSRLAIEMTPGPLSQSHVLPTPPAPLNPWGSNPNHYNWGDPQALRMPFGHLLNFFHTEDTGPRAPAPGTPAVSPHFQRLFDYVEVPSPFATAERWYNPTSFATAGLYRPPFNKLSRFRDAGRININTVYDDQIMISAFGNCWPFDAARQSTFINKLFRSRQGYGAAGTGVAMDPAFPTIFADPFRPLDAADMMPDVPASALSMRKNGQLVSPGVRRAPPVDATFFRAEPDAIPPQRNALFDHIANETTYPNVNNDYEHLYQNTERNAYFRYQTMQKLGNTFSTTSNCFAVWMTIGFFEVEDNTRNVNGTPTVVVDAGHPDGLRLGQEIGADSGEIVRHRAFYIIDRSIPVGHAPGQKLNAENCILLRRMIE